MNIPVGNRVLVKLDWEDNRQNGIIIPSTAQKTPDTAVVVALGTGKYDDKGKLIPWEVKVGDRILVDHTLDRITIKDEHGQTLDVYRQEEILGVVNESSEG